MVRSTDLAALHEEIRRMDNLGYHVAAELMRDAEREILEYRKDEIQRACENVTAPA